MQTTLPRRRRSSMASIIDNAKEQAERRELAPLEADIHQQCVEAVRTALDDPEFQASGGLI